jgi:glycosyltransferase involved in cell wall biosynthesis
MSSWPTTVPVLIPVFNHVQTVAAVIAGCRALGAAKIIVVDDGSTDGSGEAARQAGADQVITMPCNQGKGAALRLGLTEFAVAGYHQVLTIDADMQHPPGEAGRLAQAAAIQPEALWLGVRDMRGAPRSSCFGRWWTSIWTWVACGVWPQDNQTGLRVYPLPVMSRLTVGAGGYAFEIESLVRAVWKDVPLRMLPVAVSYPHDRISHFRAWADSWRTARAFARLVARRLVPWPENGIAGWRQAFTSGLSPARLAVAAAVGIALGVAPVPGLQMVLAAWLAVVFRLNLGVTLLASSISLGPLLAG